MDEDEQIATNAYYASLEGDDAPWGPHEFCAFKCGPDCDQVMELHPKVAVITDYGTIIENVQAHWDDGDRSVGIQGGYCIDEDAYGCNDMYIIWPMYAAEGMNFNATLREKVDKFREEKLANGLHV